MKSIYNDPINCDLECFQNTYTMAPELWERFSIDDLENVDFTQWKSVKLMNDDGSAFSDMVNQIPTDSGGIYVYAIEPRIIPGCGSYIMYIGMASKSANQNLRNRVRAYQRHINDPYSRERIHRLFSKWGKYVYVYFLPVHATKEIIFDLETRLIGVLTPPCNPDIRAKAVKHAVRAFR